MAQPGLPTNDPNNYFALAKQTALDTDGTTFFFFRHLDGTGWETEQESDRVREGGDGQVVSLTYRTMVKADGNIISNGRAQTAARLWAAVSGSDVIATAAVASVARHTAIPVASLPYFTMEQRYGGIIERSLNNQITGLTMEGEPGKPWKYTAAFLNGGTVTFRAIASTLTPTRESAIGKPHMYPNGSYILDGFASYATDLTKIRVEVTRGVDDAIQTTGLNRADLVPQNLDVNIDATVKFTSPDFYAKAQFSGGSNVPVNFATGSLDLTTIQQIQFNATTTVTGTHRVVVPLLEWIDAKVNKLDPDGKTMYLDVTGANVAGHPSGPYFTQIDTTDLAAY